MIRITSSAERLFLTGLRAAAIPPGPCGCLFNLYHDHFGRDGVSVLGNIFALGHILRLMPSRRFHYMHLEAETMTSDETALVEALSHTQISQYSLRQEKFSKHFHTQIPLILGDLLDGIAGTFEHHSLLFSPETRVPDLKSFNWAEQKLQ